MGVRVRIASGGVSDVGRVRTNNEDCYKIVQPLNLFVLSDGMGGEVHGEIASAMAVHLANRTIFKAAEKNPDHRGMGATLTAAWIDGAKLSIAHVGDSRAYLLRSGSLLQLTRDHSLVAEQVRRGILTA